MNHFTGNKHNFNKYGKNSIDSLGTAYDYGSVMHYGARAFTKNGKPTIVSKTPGVSPIALTKFRNGLRKPWSRCTRS